MLSRVVLVVVAIAATSVLGARAAAGPRLHYTQGPAECLTEEAFRREVTVVHKGDGVDRFDAHGAETITVSFEQLPNGRYRGTYEHPGPKDGSEIRTHQHCETLGRMVAMSVFRFVRAPDLPSPPPPAAPTPPQPEMPRPPAQPRVRPLLCALFGDEICMDLSLTAMAMGIVVAGWTPNVTGGLALGGEIHGSVLSFGLALRGVFPSRVVATERIRRGP
jgi:hypothetical protein